MGNNLPLHPGEESSVRPEAETLPAPWPGNVTDPADQHGIPGPVHSNPGADQIENLDTTTAGDEAHGRLRSPTCGRPYISPH
jgi:hypothetical protein